MMASLKKLWPSHYSMTINKHNLLITGVQYSSVTFKNSYFGQSPNDFDLTVKCSKDVYDKLEHNLLEHGQLCWKIVALEDPKIVPEVRRI